MGDVVDTSQYHDRLRVQINHILTETNQHLRSGLPADATIHEIMLDKVGRVGRPPTIGDGVTHEHDVCRNLYLFVRLGITSKLCPIAFLGLGRKRGDSEQPGGHHP